MEGQIIWIASDVKWYIGTSGFSFDDWVGTVYPEYIRKTEMFTYYWQHYGFNSVELNFTFYQIPTQKVILNLLRRAPAGFKFAVKLHNSITHGGSAENIESFLKACNILIEEEKMIGYLAQFPYNFRKNEESLNYVRKIIRILGPANIFLEFRHKSWVNCPELTQCHNNVYLVIPDLPKIIGLFPLIKAKSETVYLRLHGRNPNWFTSDEKTRYNYNYTEKELKDIIETVLPEKIQNAYVFFNNCYRGQALKNALMFRDIVGGEKIGIF
ncbi:MAG: DUF72 domain-containing protein [Fervidobacterium sp.]|nr:DUF72 domain-containing protein [Fervidobacterium sp.]